MATLNRDQQRAMHAYTSAEAVPPKHRADYKIAVNSLGPNIIRSGLAATMSWLERDKSKHASGQLLSDLAGAGLAGLPKNLKGDDLPKTVRALDVDSYTLATRDLLRLTVWLKRAVQALFGDEKKRDAAHEDDAVEGNG